MLRESGHLVGRTLAEVGRHIRPGVTTAELDAVGDAFIRKNRARPAFKGYRVGKLIYPNALCISVNEVVVHGIPGRYVLKEGDIVSVDCGVVLNGYYGDSAYTFGVGEIGEEAVALCRVTYDALNIGVQTARAGNRVGDIAYAVQEHCEEKGYGVVRELVGHGIGKNMHEEPNVPNFGEPGKGRKLKNGLVICIEPMINRGTFEVETGRDGWTVSTIDGRPSAHYEHMVAINGDEPEQLTTFDYIEEVVDAPYKEKVIHG